MDPSSLYGRRITKIMVIIPGNIHYHSNNPIIYICGIPYILVYKIREICEKDNYKLNCNKIEISVNGTHYSLEKTHIGNDNYHLFMLNCDILIENSKLRIFIGDGMDIVMPHDLVLDKDELGHNVVNDLCNFPESLPEDTEDCLGGFYHNMFAITVFVNRLDG
jgi:hypothetical protein